MGEERESFNDERENLSEDVEAHGMLDSPFGTEKEKEKEKDSEEPDVEGHSFLDSPMDSAPRDT